MIVGKCDSFDVLDFIMQGTIRSYLDPEEEPFKAVSDDEDTVEPVIVQAQERYNQLRERYITLKTMTESLKEQISSEKEELSKELKATLEMQRRNVHVCGNICIANKEEYKRNMEVFKNFIFFQSIADNLENIVKRKNYESLISEVENKCNLELLKIKENMTILKPLKDIASRWGKEKREEKICVGDASGDRLNDETEIVPLKEINKLKIDEH